MAPGLNYSTYSLESVSFSVQLFFAAFAPWGRISSVLIITVDCWWTRSGWSSPGGRRVSDIRVVNRHIMSLLRAFYAGLAQSTRVVNLSARGAAGWNRWNGLTLPGSKWKWLRWYWECDFGDSKEVTRFAVLICFFFFVTFCIELEAIPWNLLISWIERLTGDLKFNVSN